MKFALALLSMLTFNGCAHQSPSAAPQAMPAITREPSPAGPPPSTAELNGAEGSTVKGTVIFQNKGARIHVIAEFTGLQPNTEHGLHVHENGSCDGDKFAAAGGHYNPSKQKHGSKDSKSRHAGDLGNVMSDADGHAKIETDIPNGPSVDTFGGKSIILHAKRDDLKSQPAGDSGDRIACGLIKTAN